MPVCFISGGKVTNVFATLGTFVPSSNFVCPLFVLKYNILVVAPGIGGSKVPSVANTFVSFPSNMRHTGSTCTDVKFRGLINFNYIKVKENANT